MRMSWTYPTGERRARGRFETSRNDADCSVSAAMRSASASLAPCWSSFACTSARWHASSSTTSVDSWRHSAFARSRMRALQWRSCRSRILHPGEIPNQREELPPLLTLRLEHLSALRGDLVVAPPPLARLLDPAPLNPLAFFELVERGVERGEVERERAARSLFDQLRELVAMEGLVFEEREHDQLGRALLGFTDRAAEFHAADYILESRI